MKTYDKCNVIGDTHGLTSWKELVIDDAVNVFVGDYFSPHRFIPYEDVKKNFLEIIEYKKKHPQTVLLIGNHDEDHWHICEIYQRHHYEHRTEIQQLFEENKDLFQAAYSFKNQILITHAGVSKGWYESRIVGDNLEDEDRFKLTPDKVAREINRVWHEDPRVNFSFATNRKMSDYGAYSNLQSPMWIRFSALQSFNLFAGMPHVQVFGHTMVEGIESWCDEYNVFKGTMYDVDCLEHTKESLLIEIGKDRIRHIFHYSVVGPPPADQL